MRGWGWGTVTRGLGGLSLNKGSLSMLHRKIRDSECSFTERKGVWQSRLWIGSLTSAQLPELFLPQKSRSK